MLALLSQTLTAANVQNANGEKQRSGKNETDIKHDLSLQQSSVDPQAVSKNISSRPGNIRRRNQNFTMMAMSMNDSFLRRSGNQTLLGPPPQAASARPKFVCPDEEPLLQT